MSDEQPIKPLAAGDLALQIAINALKDGTLEQRDGENVSDEQEPKQLIEGLSITLDGNLITERLAARFAAEMLKRKKKPEGDDEEKPETE